VSWPLLPWLRMMSEAFGLVLLRMGNAARNYLRWEWRSAATSARMLSHCASVGLSDSCVALLAALHACVCRLCQARARNVPGAQRKSKLIVGDVLRRLSVRHALDFEHVYRTSRASQCM